MSLLPAQGRIPDDRRYTDTFTTATVTDSAFMNKLTYILENPASLNDSAFAQNFEHFSAKYKYLEIACVNLAAWDHSKVKKNYRLANVPYPDITGIDLNGLYVLINFTDCPNPTMGYMVKYRGKYIFFSSFFDGYTRVIKPDKRKVKLSCCGFLFCSTMPMDDLCLHYINGEFHVADHNKIYFDIPGFDD